MMTKSTRNCQEQGSIIVEMAIVLPVMIVFFLGLIEISQYYMLRERVNKVANNVATSIATMPPDMMATINHTTFLDSNLTASEPFRSMSIAVQFCEHNVADPYSTNQFPSGGYQRTGTTNNCTNKSATCTKTTSDAGYGAYVSARACAEYKPTILPRYFINTTEISIQVEGPFYYANVIK